MKAIEGFEFKVLKKLMWNRVNKGIIEIKDMSELVTIDLEKSLPH